jgi:NAD+ kinase
LSGSELIICLGGDGTILGVASHMKEHSIPILGVNLGSLGFLTEVKETEVFEELNSYFLGSFSLEERLMIACSARSEKAKKERRFVALNDIVVNREGLSRLLHIEVCVAGEKLTSFAGDGVIVATPTGSTAYSLSAGGPIVHPKLDNLIVTPICPHASALRPMVVGGDEKISIRLQNIHEGDKALLTADGQENLEIDDTFNIEITRSSVPLRLVKSSKRSYFATLRENFKFP